MRSGESEAYGSDDGEFRRPGPAPFDWVVLIVHAALRRKLLGAAVLIAGLAACVVFFRMKVPLYRVEAVILAQRQQALPSSVRPTMEDLPTRSAWEMIHRRENLVSVISAAGLLGTPSQGGGLKEMLSELPGTRQRAEPADPLDLMVRRLDKALKVTTDEGTIAMSIDWPDPQQAYLIIQTSLQNFIEARHVQEVTAIDEVISVLRGRLAVARDSLERVVLQVQHEVSTRGGRSARTADPLAPAATAGAGAGARQSEELVRLRSLVEAKQRALDDVEEIRRRRMADLQAQLDERRGQYSEAHPVIIGLRKDIESFSRESPQILAIREELAKLRRDYAARLAAEGGRDRTLDRAASVPPASAEDDARVREARANYQQMLDRVSSAQLELDAIRAAFKYRYNVIWPPQEPKEPVSPNPFKILGAGAFASLVLALLVAAAPDLLKGRILERWQVERSLGLDVLAQLPPR